MAKISHPNFVDTINDILIEAKKREVILLESRSSSWSGNVLNINNKELVNFGTCGYLGLENHPRVIEKTIEFTRLFGTQFSVSRSYVISEQNKILEALLSEIFNNKPVIVYTSTTLAHISVLPIMVGPNDAIILDQQAHISIQNAAQLMAAKGVPIEIIRHSNMEMLEHKTKAIYDKYEKIWYMIDGVYSMFGDIAPINDINALMTKYSKLHLYVDDAHGMSWSGINGCGRIFKECETNEKTVYISTLAKGFGTMGGIAVFPNNTLYNKVIMHGGPLAHSHPIPPPMMGASIASAQIHLSSEITELQNKLREKLNYAQELFKNSRLPIVSNPETPIFFVGTGQPTVGYNLNSKIINAGYYVNIGLFPAVPIKNTGLRFTINNHLSNQQIKSFIETIEHYYPLALEEEGKTLNDVYKAFKMPLLPEENITEKVQEKTQSLSIKIHKSINEINKELWDCHFANKGNFDWDALLMMENAFSQNKLKEENWEFNYVLIFDKKNELILATFFTVTTFKDDMFSPVNVSQLIEQERQNNPYYLCSKTLSMGSLFTEGDHLFINRLHQQYKDALKFLIKWAMETQEKENCNSVVMSDFEENDLELSGLFHEEGFFKIKMPNTNIINNLPPNLSDIYNNLNTKNKKHYRNDVLLKKDEIKFITKQQLEPSELLHA